MEEKLNGLSRLLFQLLFLVDKWVSKIFSGTAVVPLTKRMPLPAGEIDTSFCHNTPRGLYGVPPDPL
jgi:hypothetical protein